VREIVKFPRTQHLQGSQLQPGDGDLEQVSFASLHDTFVVVEEKVDGANAAVSFDPDDGRSGVAVAWTRAPGRTPGGSV
jgi:hypothetical protein